MAQLTVTNKIGKLAQLGIWIYDATARLLVKKPPFSLS